MTLAEIGRAGQRSDPLTGGDVADDGRLLSVEEIQQRFRADRGRPILPALSSGSRVDAPTCLVKGTVGRPRIPLGSAAPGRPPAAVSDSLGPEGSSSGDLHLPSGWIRVIGGHGGAGASTVALALADAAAAAGHTVRLIEAAHPARSGLIAATSAELGLDDTGAWARGTRGAPTSPGQLTVTRRAGDCSPGGWPADSRDPAEGSRRGAPGPRGAVRAVVSIVDLGLAPVDALAGLAHSGERVVITCRATIPGLRQVEQVLDRLDETAEVLLAVVGPRRWPGEVTATGRQGIGRLRAGGRVVTVPYSRRLAVTGVTYLPFPKPIRAAGTTLWRVLDATAPATGEPLDRTSSAVAGATR